MLYNFIAISWFCIYQELKICHQSEQYYVGTFETLEEAQRKRGSIPVDPTARAAYFSQLKEEKEEAKAAKEEAKEEAKMEKKKTADTTIFKSFDFYLAVEK